MFSQTYSQPLRKPKSKAYIIIAVVSVAVIVSVVLGVLLLNSNYSTYPTYKEFLDNYEADKYAPGDVVVCRDELSIVLYHTYMNDTGIRFKSTPGDFPQYWFDGDQTDIYHVGDKVEFIIHVREGGFGITSIEKI